MWKLWQHSCPTQVPGIRYNMLPVPQEESLAPGMPLGQQRPAQPTWAEDRQHVPKLQRSQQRGMDGHPVAPDIAARQFTPSPTTAMMILPVDWNVLNSRPSRRTVHGDNCDELYASLDIQYKCPASLRVKVDTGAHGNILLLRIFCRMFPEKLDPNGYPAKGTTKKRQTILQAYNGTTIKQLGVVTLSCKHKDTEWHSSDIFVTESEGPAILGLPSSRQLRL